MRLSLPIVVLSVVLGSGCNSGHRPTEPTDPKQTPTPTPTVTPPAPNARVTGHVVDVDTGKPVAHAIVSVAGVCYSGTPFGRCMNAMSDSHASGLTSSGRVAPCR